MYLFVYRGPKHIYYYDEHRQASTYYYDERRQASTHGQFELAKLRLCLKDKFKIYGYGKHPIHRLLQKSQLASGLLHGHIIEVTDANAAVWLKLNYDQVTKNLKYMGNIGPIDNSEIESLEEQITICSKNIGSLKDQVKKLTGTQFYLKGLLHDKADNSVIASDNEFIQLIKNTINHSFQLETKIKKQIVEQQEQHNRAIEKVKIYISEKTTGK